MFYEFIRREIVYQISYREIKKTEEYRKIKNWREKWKFIRNFTKIFKEEYNKTHLSKIVDKGEEQWPALKKYFEIYWLGVDHNWSNLSIQFCSKSNFSIHLTNGSKRTA
ncbi:MAG: hypothetical protein ABI342_01655 [Nitrososphaera sp.]